MEHSQQFQQSAGDLGLQAAPLWFMPPPAFETDTIKKQQAATLGFQTQTMRHELFALSALASSPLRVSLKCEPELAEQLRGSYPDAVVPGYHLNKRHWNTVLCDGDALPDAMVRDMVEDSYDLVVAAMPRVVRERLGWRVSA